MEIIELKKERAILVGVCLPKEDSKLKEKSLDELERLANTADIDVVGRTVQNRKGIDSATYVGKGFMESLQLMAEELEADMLIFDNELSPSQGRNIEKIYKIQAIDRTEVILEIFARHAKTKEAKLQVKLAQLKYQLPRLKKLWSHLDREGGGKASSSGAATRGMGEKQIEIDKRIVKREIQKVEEQLEKIMKQHETQRKGRQNIKKVCLVGYTNAGKTTLFNAITGSDVYVEDQLFATLDSTSRALELDKGKDIIISDTVGFISNLPHHLVASFRATLEEVIDADLLLHVTDVSDPMFEHYIKEVNFVLKEINAENIPQVSVFNKTDNFENPKEALEELLIPKEEKQIFLSAKTGKNIDALFKLLDDELYSTNIHELLIPFTDSKFASEVYSLGNVLEKEYIEEGLRIKIEVNDEHKRKIDKFIKKD